MAEKRIRGFLIFEILGRPIEHLRKTLHEFIDKIGSEPGVQLKDKKIHEPKPIENVKHELYTSFAETEIEFKDMPTLFKIVFGYMPSHIEIVEPEELGIKNFDLNLLMNELTRRLHQYDEIAKGLAIERGIMQQRLQQAGIMPQPVENPQKEDAQKKTDKKTKTKKSKKKR